MDPAWIRVQYSVQEQNIKKQNVLFSATCDFQHEIIAPLGAMRAAIAVVIVVYIMDPTLVAEAGN